MLVSKMWTACMIDSSTYCQAIIQFDYFIQLPNTIPSEDRRGSFRTPHKWEYPQEGQQQQLHWKKAPSLQSSLLFSCLINVRYLSDWEAVIWAQLLGKAEVNQRSLCMYPLPVISRLVFSKDTRGRKNTLRRAMLGLWFFPQTINLS